MAPASHDGEPFRAFHRAAIRARAARVVTTLALVIGVVGGMSALASQAPPPVAAPGVPAVSAAPPVELPTPVPTEPASPSLAPIEAPPAEPAPTPVPEEPAPAPVPDARQWSIAIDTVGHQAEIDQCLWVRMDLNASAPIVGAHNYCGGAIVLEMSIGDTVTLTGTGLDGTYRVSEERLAWAGQIAAEATEGFVATVILQTCHWVNDGSERLVALVPAEAGASGVTSQP